MNKMSVIVKCRMCNTDHEIEVKQEGWMKWRHDTLIQDAMPELSAEERELLVSGTCGTCFDEMFGDCYED